jgi:hypothetical protein
MRLQALHRAPPQQQTPSVLKQEGGPAASMKPGQKSYVIKLIKSAYTLSAWSLVKHPLKDDEAAGLHIVGTEPSEAPTEGQQSQWSESRRGHQCSETTLTGGSWFHISTPLGIWTRVSHDGSKRAVYWTSETWWEWSEISGSPQYGLSDAFWKSVSSQIPRRLLERLSISPCDFRKTMRHFSV